MHDISKVELPPLREAIPMCFPEHTCPCKHTMHFAGLQLAGLQLAGLQLVTSPVQITENDRCRIFLN
jgi:hypothetical protein